MNIYKEINTSKELHDFYLNIDAFRAINENRENEIIDSLKSLRSEMTRLENYVSQYYTGLEVPEMYNKLITFLNKNFKIIDELFQIKHNADVRTVNLVLGDIEEVIVRLKDRINIVSKFLLLPENVYAA